MMQPVGTKATLEEVCSPPTSLLPQSILGEAALSRKKEKKANKVKQKIKIVDSSVDVRVQHTNDDSVVSKRSAVAHNYIRDTFLRHFVKKPSRRSPLVNRGYYLRMAIMTDLVVRLVKGYFKAPERLASVTPSSPCPPPVQVISLGAGYDTLAFRLLLASVDLITRDSSYAAASPSSLLSSPSSEHVSFPGGEVLFLDVDFPAVLSSKAALMAAAPPHTFPTDWQFSPQRYACPVRSPFYSAVGVDLRAAQTELLPRLHQYGPAGFSALNPTIIYAECVMQYMPSEDAAALLALLAASFPNAVFLAYDQVSPSDSFGHVMQNSLRQKNSPLLGIQSCPDGAHMTRRAHAAGMRRAWWGDFYRISAFCLAGAETARVDALEEFDELEEWSEMCEHYGITMSITSTAWDSIATNYCAAHPAFVEYSVGGIPLNTRDVSRSKLPASVKGTLHSWPSARYGFEGWGNGGVAVEPLANGDRLLISFGGFAAGKQHQRVSTVYVHSLQEGELPVVVADKDIHTTGSDGKCTRSAHPPPMVFHTFSHLAPGKYLVWGGRTNPSSPSNDAYLLTLELPPTVRSGSPVTARWRALSVCSDDEPCCCPSPRFRHSMVSLGGTADEAILLLLGGKCSDPGVGEELECIRVTVSMRCLTISYEVLDCCAAAGLVPPPLHSAAAIALSSDLVLVHGGVVLGRDVCNKHIWQLRLSTRKWSRLTVSHDEGRYAHSLTRVTVDDEDFLLILGGSSCTSKADIPLGMLLPLSVFDHHCDEATASATAAVVSFPAEAPWWSRHSCVALGKGVVGVLGGGYTCFSFGTYTAKPQLLFLGETVDEKAWRLSTSSPAVSYRRGGTGVSYPTAPGVVYSYDQLLSRPWGGVREYTHYSAAAFLDVSKEATQPVVFREVPLGGCLSKWGSSQYLKKTEGKSLVSVHVCERSQRLDFVRKNFTFRHVTLEKLIEHFEDATKDFCKTHEPERETWYFRSVAAHMKSERSNLWTDFPELGKDFVLPPGAKEYIEPRIHQSCLRMSAPPLELWTHYDTLDNVLCQVVGTKRVVLFPPSEYNNLYMAGSSSAVVNIDTPDLVRYPRFIEACKAAQEVILRPGDMLFIPSMWFHQITTLLTDAEVTHSEDASVSDLYNISVNVFYRHFSDPTVYDAKDLYGNKDIPAVSRTREDLYSAVRDVVANARLTEGDNAPHFPPTYVEFSLRQFMQDLERSLTEISNTPNT